MQLKTRFSAILDHRRPQGRMYGLGHLLLFSVLAVALGATSYRKIQRFMNTHRERLNELCQLHWKRAPAHNSIRYALHGLKAKEVEAVFRDHAAELDGERPERFDTRLKDWQVSEETAYYLREPAARFNQAIRGHWGVENRTHCVRDTSLQEDASRIRRNPCIFALLRSFALNLMRFNRVENISLGLYDHALILDRVLANEGL